MKLKLRNFKKADSLVSMIAALAGCLGLAAGEAPTGADTPVAAKLPFGMVDVPSRVVLTGNPGEGELALEVGATYTAVPPFHNPADPQNRRLLDGDQPANWNTTSGINHQDQVVTFDLKEKRSLAEVALLFDLPQKPKSVEIAVADEPDGPWRAVGTLAGPEQKEPWWRLPLKAATGRYLRLDCRLGEWGWYLREARIYSETAATAGASLRRADQLVLIDQTGPRASLVLAARAQANALEAAMVFQQLAQRMTGTFLPIVPESRFDGRSTAIFIGDSQLARARGVQVEQTPLGGERYVMRTGENWLALVGNDARPNAEFAGGMKPFRGSIYAVYDFFERLGCGWYGPDPLWQVVPPAQILSAPALAVAESPAFSMRDLWLGGLPHPALRDAWRLGGLYIRSGHSYDQLVPPGQYKAAHPEWFGEGQPDLTHPEVIRVAVENLRAQLDARPDEPLVTFAVGSNDTGGYKEPPHRPEVGNIAAQQLHFANEIARGLRRSHPARHFALGIYGYWHSHDGPAPPLTGEPEVNVYLVNEGNHAKPLDLPETPERARNTGRNNTRELAAIASWKKTGRLTGIYEWWIPVLANPVWKDAPWYDGDTALRNLRWWRSEGIRNLTYEIQGEHGFGFPLRWAQYYIAARGMWNPGLDSHAVLREACGKLYGPAAPSMTSFYELQQEAMHSTTEHVGNWALPAPHLIYTASMEARGDLLLEQAEKQLASLPPHEPALARWAVERKGWSRLKEINATARANADSSYRVVLDGQERIVPSPTLDAAAVRSLFGLPADTALEVLERDGQNRATLAGETYDVRTGLTFRAAPAR